jgi:hypothetical protein
MRISVLLAFLTAIVVGCAVRLPVVPDAGNAGLQIVHNAELVNDQHRLWGEWLWYINTNHDRIDVIPQRQARLHLNALKFLESYCTNCLKITKIKNNGDGTIDVTVRITHPFPAHPEYTGFDVKGIVMFNGSHLIFWTDGLIDPEDYVKVSWRKKGDPELLNPDGYTRRWSPTWNSGSSLPIFNYWPGKYSSGKPTAEINGYLDYFTDENRHMFRVGQSVDRVFHISLPPGPLVVGYAVEACWEPPTVMPVTNPANDFPYSANQSEAYHFKFTVNNNGPITATPCCYETEECQGSQIMLEYAVWYGPQAPRSVDFDPGVKPTTTEYPKSCADNPELSFIWGYNFSDYPNGDYRGVLVAFNVIGFDQTRLDISYALFDWTVNIK